MCAAIYSNERDGDMQDFSSNCVKKYECHHYKGYLKLFDLIWTSSRDDNSFSKMLFKSPRLNI
uniref:Uncharacterized protein n=1 Tax=Solanum lycopersicum TaxID=4081 RepID=A0A3Q7F535_SOLLC